MAHLRCDLPLLVASQNNLKPSLQEQKLEVKVSNYTKEKQSKKIKLSLKKD
ncbi:unnamed protein product [Brassica rapa subsp. narinosa]